MWNPFRRDKAAVLEAQRRAEQAKLDLERAKLQTPHFERLGTSMIGIRTRNSLSEKLTHAFQGPR